MRNDTEKGGGDSNNITFLTEEEELSVRHLNLLTMKKVIFLANVDDSSVPVYAAAARDRGVSPAIPGSSGTSGDGTTGEDKGAAELADYVAGQGGQLVCASASFESEMGELDPEDRELFLLDAGLSPGETGLTALIQATYAELGLRTYFTSGPTETRAWTIKSGSLAPQAAGVIHTDFERGFIRAETISYTDMVDCGNEKVAKDKGMLRSEGKDYEVQEGDIILFRFNV